MNFIHIHDYFLTPSAESLAYRNHVIEIMPSEEEKEEIETLQTTLRRLILRWETKTNDESDVFTIQKNTKRPPL